MFGFGGNQYGVMGFSQTLQGQHEEITTSFEGLVQQAYKANGIVFACMRARQALFSEARFRYRRLRNGKPGDLFGDRSLRVLETPEPGKTTSDLLARAIQDADIGGTAFHARRVGGIKRMRPDWVTIVLGSESGDLQAGDLDVEVIGFVYHPGGRNSGREPVTLLANQVAISMRAAFTCSAPGLRQILATNRTREPVRFLSTPIRARTSGTAVTMTRNLYRITSVPHVFAEGRLPTVGRAFSLSMADV
jgi:hypothetical protein